MALLKNADLHSRIQAIIVVGYFSSFVFSHIFLHSSSWLNSFCCFKRSDIFVTVYVCNDREEEEEGG